MKNFTFSLSRLALVIAGALSLGACSRAEYATSSHVATTPLASSVASQPLPASEQAAPYVPVAAEESAVVKAPAAAVAAQPVAPNAAPQAAPAALAAAAPAATVAATKPAPKLNLVQRLALRKITKKLDKLTAQVPQFKKQDAAARGGLDSNLRSAILFGLVGLIVLLFSGVSQIFGIVGAILLIIGLVFLVLWLLDQA